MLDRLPATWRHFLIGLLAAVLTVVAQYVPELGLHPALAAVLGSIVGYVLLWITPLIRQYGVGHADEDHLLEGEAE